MLMVYNFCYYDKYLIKKHFRRIKIHFSCGFSGSIVSESCEADHSSREHVVEKSC